MEKLKEKLLIALILVIGFVFRFNNLNWDENFHLHPDERFLTMVGNAMTLPKSINEYLDPEASKLNPSNIGYNFFVYGDFPLILTKILAVNNNLDSYNDFTILGRYLSASLDLLIIIIVFKVSKLLFPKQKEIHFWSAFFYAIAVYPIQASHFFTVDTFLSLFMFFSFYFSLKSNYKKYLQNTVLSAIFFGLAVASKISALYILPLILFFIVTGILQKYKIKELLKKRLFHFISFSTLILGLFFLIVYLTVRFSNPYYFQTADLLNSQLNKEFINSINQLKNFTGKNIWYPPAVQWTNKPVTFLLTNLMLVGVGLPCFVFLIIGFIWILKNLKLKPLDVFYKTKKYTLAVILIWVFGYFFYQSFQPFKSIRYTIYLYPFFALISGVGINFILKNIKNRLFINISSLIFVILLLSWPLLFSTVYFFKNTRVEASEWIYKNLQNNSLILSESWDDGLPLPVLKNHGKQFNGEQLPIFDADTPEKWQRMDNLLNKADYYILSSNRGWGSIPTAPEKYPKMSQFYKELLEDKNPNYKKIKQFNPYYYQFLKFPNNWVEETFTVYDHPQVLIYKNVKKL